jgi:hypothetical protein
MPPAKHPRRGLARAIGVLSLSFCKANFELDSRPASWACTVREYADLFIFVPDILALGKNPTDK